MCLQQFTWFSKPRNFILQIRFPRKTLRITFNDQDKSPLQTWLSIIWLACSWTSSIQAPTSWKCRIQSSLRWCFDCRCPCQDCPVERREKLWGCGSHHRTYNVRRWRQPHFSELWIETQRFDKRVRHLHDCRWSPNWSWCFGPLLGSWPLESWYSSRFCDIC